MALLNEFCQREVETSFDLGSGIHRDAKTGTARLTAIDRDNEGVITPNFVGLVHVLAGKKYPILDGNRTQLASTHPDKGERFGYLLVFDD